MLLRRIFILFALYNIQRLAAEKCENSHESFTCLTAGLFDDPNDPTCTKYYVCSFKKHGKLRKSHKHCRNGQKFDATLKECTKDYNCSCSDNSDYNRHKRDDNYTAFVCETEGLFPDPNEFFCSNYYLCLKTYDKSFLQVKYSCPSGTHFDPYLEECNSYQCNQDSSSASVPDISTKIPDQCRTHKEVLKCGEAGRFAKPNELSCTKYYLCSKLRNGSFIQTEYSCPIGSYFDPDLSRCSASFQCPCLDTTPVSFTPTTKKPTTISIHECEENEDFNFNCTRKGRFKKPNDLSCTKYFLCSILRNGSFIQKEYTCPEGSYFDENRQSCSIEYHCPCTNLSSSTPHWSSNPESTTIFEWTTSSTTDSECRTDKNSNFTCKGKGRFRKPNDLTCSKYYLCSSLRNGSIIETEYSCPDGSYFDTNLHACSTEFQCPCSTPKWTQTSTETAESTTITSILPTIPNECQINEDFTFSCTEKGRFKKPNDLSCTKYYLCLLLRNGSFIQTEYTCPNASYFDTNLHYCNIKFQCPCSVPTTSQEASSSTTPKECQIDQNSSFNCQQKGRFKKPNDFSCTQYYLCSPLRNGSYIQTEYKCPEGSYFDSNFHYCNSDYECPCSGTLRTTPYPLY